MIKKIHYCWFGGAVPPNVAENVEKWKRLNPDFEICEWNLRNSDFSKFAFAQRALEEKRWAFISDVVRLQMLYEHGGVYLDTDVELIRPFNMLADESDYLVMGYMYPCTLGTGVIHCPPCHPLIAAVLDEYHHVLPGMWPVNNTMFTDYFLNHVPGFLLNGRCWKSETEKISLYPKEYFEQPAFIRESGFSIHHYSGSWMPENRGKAYTTYGGGTWHKIKWLKRELRTVLSVFSSGYSAIYWKAQLGIATKKMSEWRELAD